MRCSNAGIRRHTGQRGERFGQQPRVQLLSETLAMEVSAAVGEDGTPLDRQRRSAVERRAALNWNASKIDLRVPSMVRSLQRPVDATMSATHTIPLQKDSTLEMQLLRRRAAVARPRHCRYVGVVQQAPAQD